MAEPKVQLVAPIGNISVPGMNVTGVVTASVISGNVTIGAAASIIQGNNIDIGAGIITATSFVGDQIGTYRAASLTGSPDLVIGVVTASSYVGDTTGAATSIIQGTNTNAGNFNATTFVGNVTGNITGDVTGHATGIGGSIKQGVNLNVGVATAVWYGDGSSLTGLAATGGYAAQNVTTGIGASGYETIIDLSYGNLIYYKGRSDTTVGFASTSSTPEEIIFLRDTDPNYDLSVTTGAVTIDGSDDYISIPASSEYDIGTGDFTVECWINADALNTGGHYRRVWEIGASTSDSIGIDIQPEGVCNLRIDDSVILNTGSGVISTGTWTHIAVCRKSSTMTLYINGTTSYSGGTSSASNSTDIDQSSNTFYIGANHAQPANSSWDGKISNFRYATSAVYDGNFIPPLIELTAVTGTKILCCQSDSSATTAADSPGTLTVNGTVTAAAATIDIGLGSAITWPTTTIWNGGTEPTLLGANSYSFAGQVFNLVTADGGTTWYGYEEVSNTDYSASGSLYMWGQNEYGNLGLNNTTDVNSAGGSQVGSETTWNNLSGSYYTPMGTKTDGTLWTWGKNEKGSQGLSTAESSSISSPTQIPGTTWKYAADVYGPGGRHNTAIKTDGTLWAWGENSSGGLGQNSLTKYSSPVQIPGTTWQSIVTNYGYYMFATKTDGSLWSWGGNNFGVLGHNESSVKYSSPVQIPGTWGSSIEGKISVGQNYAVAAIKTDGTLWTWGENQIGVLGHNQADGQRISSPTQVPGTTWKSIAFNSSSCISATKTDGTLWSWGYWEYGGLGIHGEVNYSSPVQVPGTTTWDRVWTSKNGSMKATRTDGTLWGWGSGTIGGTGPGNKSSPTQIPGTWGRQGQAGGIKL